MLTKVTKIFVLTIRSYIHSFLLCDEVLIYDE